jgi:hypothetical protein
MAKRAEDIAADIDAFQPIHGNWLGLDALLEELWKEHSPQDAIPELLRVFERFPDDDGAGVFWSIVHGLETLPNYQAQLLASVRRVPSCIGVTMLGRLLNAGCHDIDGVPIRQILQEIIMRSDAGENAKDTAQSFLKHAEPRRFRRGAGTKPA